MTFVESFEPSRIKCNDLKSIFQAVNSVITVLICQKIQKEKKIFINFFEKLRAFLYKNQRP